MRWKETRPQQIIDGPKSTEYARRRHQKEFRSKKEETRNLNRKDDYMQKMRHKKLKQSKQLGVCRTVPPEKLFIYTTNEGEKKG